MNENIGIIHFWAQGDAVSHGVIIVLLVMSVTSWTIIVRKAINWRKFNASVDHGLEEFWQSAFLVDGLQVLRQDETLLAVTHMAEEALKVFDAMEQATVPRAGPRADLGEILGRTLQQSINIAQTRQEHGLTFLASVGATAPFVGLLGTVWGIYHALIGLSGASHVVLDRVAGPVGEALIMTAAGLFVAIPAVLAYNTFVRTNRSIMARLEAFAHQLHVFYTTGIRPTLYGEPVGQRTRVHGLQSDRA